MFEYLSNCQLWESFKIRINAVSNLQTTSPLGNYFVHNLGRGASKLWEIPLTGQNKSKSTLIRILRTKVYLFLVFTNILLQLCEMGLTLSSVQSSCCNSQQTLSLSSLKFSTKHNLPTFLVCKRKQTVTSPRLPALRN